MGLSEDGKFADGYEAIFGKKPAKFEADKPAAKKPAEKKPTAKKKPAKKK